MEDIIKPQGCQMLSVAGCGLRVTICGVRVARLGLCVARYELRVTGCVFIAPVKCSSGKSVSLLFSEKGYKISPAHNISQKFCQGSTVIWGEIFLGRCSFEMMKLLRHLFSS